MLHIRVHVHGRWLGGMQTLVMDVTTTVNVLVIPHTILHILFMMTTTVNQVAILHHLVSGTWIIHFGTDRVVPLPPVAVTTALCRGFGAHYRTLLILIWKFVGWPQWDKE